MKNISPALAAHLNEELTTIALLVKIKRADGVVIAFTNHDTDIIMDGITYKADGGFNIGSLTYGVTLDDDAAAALNGVLEHAVIKESDLHAGLYDNAEVALFMTNWQAPNDGAIIMRQGNIGEVKWHDNAFHAEFRPLSARLRQTIGDVFTAECRHALGDGNCKIAPTGASGTVSYVTDNITFQDDTLDGTTDLYTRGSITWLSGANAGIKCEVRSYNAAERSFVLWLPPPSAIAVGDTYQISQGCDKRLVTCTNRFNNAVNFGGFPLLPGIGKVLRYP